MQSSSVAGNTEVSPELAALALVRLAKDNENVHLIATGPLTNLAIAHSLGTYYLIQITLKAKQML